MYRSAWPFQHVSAPVIKVDLLPNGQVFHQWTWADRKQTWWYHCRVASKHDILKQDMEIYIHLTYVQLNLLQECNRLKTGEGRGSLLCGCGEIRSKKHCLNKEFPKRHLVNSSLVWWDQNWIMALKQSTTFGRNPTLLITLKTPPPPQWSMVMVASCRTLLLANLVPITINLNVILN